MTPNNKTTKEMLESLQSKMGKIVVAFHYESLLNFFKKPWLAEIKVRKTWKSSLTVNLMVTRAKQKGCSEDGKLPWFCGTRC